MLCGNPYKDANRVRNAARNREVPGDKWKSFPIRKKMYKTGELPCTVPGVLIYIYYFLDKSTNRKQCHKEFQVLCGKDTRKILKLVNTRWLSLCLNRLLDMWQPLERYTAGYVRTVVEILRQ